MYLDKFLFLKSNKVIASKLLEVLQAEEVEVKEKLYAASVAALYDSKQREGALHLDGRRMLLSELQTIIRNVLEGKK